MKNVSITSMLRMEFESIIAVFQPSKPPVLDSASTIVDDTSISLKKFYTFTYRVRWILTGLKLCLHEASRETRQVGRLPGPSYLPETRS
jgi:hypothetical protein